MLPALPAEFGDGPFSVAEALSRGVRPDRLRRRDLRADYHGVRVPIHLPKDLESYCRAYATRLHPGQFFSHVTAAHLWGMRLPGRVENAPLHVTTVRPARAPRTRGVVGHHADAPGPELVRHRGFLLPRPAETWRMLSTHLTLDELIVAGDGLVGRREAIATVPQLRRAVARNAGRRGNLSLRAAFEQVRPRTDSPRETTLRLLVIRAGLPEPEVNGRLTEDGERERFGDLVFRPWHVVLEYEGAHHQQSRSAYLDDIDRYGELSARWRFVRVAKEHTPEQIILRTSAALRASGWRP